MKKFGYISIGLIIGVVLSLTVSVYGAEIGMIGKKVQGELNITVNGQIVGSAVVIDGKSFAPVRMIGETAGYEVGFESGGVTMNSKVEGNPEQSGGEFVNDPAIAETNDLAAIKRRIEFLKLEEIAQQNYLDPKINIPHESREKARIRLQDIEAELSLLEAQKAALEAQQ